MFKVYLIKLIYLGALLLSATVSAQHETHWVATWGSALPLAVAGQPEWMQPPPADSLPADPLPSPIPPVPAQLNDQTVRMLVRTSVGGEQLRLQFSNAQGLSPVTLGAVHVAIHTNGSNIDPQSDREVTFGGNSSVTIHPGALLISDPVELSIEALTELSVSVYLPENTTTLSRHDLGLNTTYIAKGNVVSASSLVSDESNLSYFWLTGVEVSALRGTASIIAFGDSITDGYSSTPDVHGAWPALLAERLQKEDSTRHFGVVNMGISGNRVLRDGAGASALARFDRDVLARAGVEWLILLEGINDITFTALPGLPLSQQTTAAEIIEGLSQLVDRAHAHGIKVMGATLTPMAGLWLFNEQTEGMRQSVNDWIRNGGKYDAVVDFDAITKDSAAPHQLNSKFDSGDFIHPNDAGNVAMAEAVDLSVFIP